MTRSRILRFLLASAGVLCVALATAGVFLPLLPTTPFLLLAAACFMRSSDRLHDWLLGHRWFGSYIRNYRENRSITRGALIVTLVLLWTTLGFSIIWVAQSTLLRAVLVGVGVGVTLHLMRLRGRS